MQRPIPMMALAGLWATLASATPVIRMEISGDLVSRAGSVGSGDSMLRSLSSMATFEGADNGSALASMFFNEGGSVDDSSSMVSALLRPSTSAYLSASSGSGKGGALAISLDALNGANRAGANGTAMVGAMSLPGTTNGYLGLWSSQGTGLRSGARALGITSAWQLNLSGTADDGLSGTAGSGTAGTSGTAAAGSGSNSQGSSTDVIRNTLSTSIGSYDNYDSEQMLDVLSSSAENGAAVLFGSQDGTPQLTFSSASSTPPPSNIPEPATMGLLGAGLMGLALLGRKRR